MCVTNGFRVIGLQWAIAFNDSVLNFFYKIAEELSKSYPNNYQSHHKKHKMQKLIKDVLESLKKINQFLQILLAFKLVTDKRGFKY